MLGSHIYYTNSFSAWKISGNDKVHRNENNIPNLYILEIDSSVFKIVQVSSIFLQV